MPKVRITKEFTFEAVHALEGYDGPCKNIHGHSYALSVTVIGDPSLNQDTPKKGMVMDFGDLKRMIKTSIIDPFDHALILQSGAQKESLGMIHGEICDNVIIVGYQPTSENMLIDFAGKIAKLLPSTLKLHSLRLRETGTSYAEWFAEDQVV